MCNLFEQLIYSYEVNLFFVRMLILFFLVVIFWLAFIASLILRKLEIGKQDIEEGRNKLKDGWHKYHSNNWFLIRWFAEDELKRGKHKLLDGERELAEGEKKFSKWLDIYFSIKYTVVCLLIFIFVFILIEALVVRC